MNLEELKSMIAEEYYNYLAEQDEPTVAVSDADVDADGGEDAEETLKDIFDMLKDYFEGDDDDKDDDAPEDAALQERFKKLANIINGKYL